MITIGITGGIGSGKSTVCKVFELLGVPVSYADDVARKIVNEDPYVVTAIAKTFGNSILTIEKTIDRKKLAALVFNNKENLEKLNAITHPAVGIYFEKWAKKQESHPYIIKEAAILFESGADKQVDKVITVTAPLELKIKRILQRDGITREQILQRMNNQLNDEEKIKRSQFVIVNDEQSLLIPQILSLHTKLTADK